VERSLTIKVEFQDVKGKKRSKRFRDWEARIFQHEYDHLDGVLYIDRLTPEGRQAVRAPRVPPRLCRHGHQDVRVCVCMYVCVYVPWVRICGALRALVLDRVTMGPRGLTLVVGVTLSSSRYSRCWTSLLGTSDQEGRCDRQLGVYSVGCNHRVQQ
jgi:hypothetical protein